MATFTLGTSGRVNLGKAAFPFHNEYVEWSDLSPFAQGYVEALFASNDPMRWASTSSPAHTIAPAFSRLDPSALALILRDCEAGARIYIKHRRDDGAHFWRWRQAEGARHGFPPLTPFLSDEGKVCLREAARG